VARLLTLTRQSAVGDLDVTQVASAGDHVRLMAVVAQTRNLPEAQLPFEEAHGLVVQSACGLQVKRVSMASLRRPGAYWANRSVSAPSVGAAAVRFPTAIVGIVLTEFSAYLLSKETPAYGRQG
jgi:hypothetical protein